MTSTSVRYSTIHLHASILDKFETKASCSLLHTAAAKQVLIIPARSVKLFDCGPFGHHSFSAATSNTFVESAFKIDSDRTTPFYKLSSFDTVALYFWFRVHPAQKRRITLNRHFHRWTTDKGTATGYDKSISRAELEHKLRAATAAHTLLTSIWHFQRHAIINVF